MIQSILITLISGFIGILIGQRLRLDGDSHVKRKRFRSVVELMRRRMESKSAGEFYHSPKDREMAQLEAEVLEVRHHIAGRLVSRFDAAVADYKSVSFDGWSGPDVKRQQERDAQNEKAKSQLLASLEDLHRYARWMV